MEDKKTVNKKASEPTYEELEAAMQSLTEK